MVFLSQRIKLPSRCQENPNPPGAVHCEKSVSEDQEGGRGGIGFAVDFWWDAASGDTEQGVLELKGSLVEALGYERVGGSSPSLQLKTTPYLPPAAKI